jgi:hypothetical protein
MPSDLVYLTHEQAIARLMAASKRVKRRTAKSFLRDLEGVPDPDNGGQRLWREDDVIFLCGEVQKTSVW